MRNHSSVPPRWRQTALAVALGLSFGGSALAQSTTGSILGTAPIAAGESVRITNKQTGLTREVPVDANGRYAANTLPVGDYSVALIVNGTVAATQQNVNVSVSGPATVPFTAAPSGAQNLSGVTVTAGAIPPIDVASTRQTAVITDKDLKVLPLDRDAESIALLAPGVALGAGSLGTGPAGTPLVSFSGNSVVENAYYINGFNTTDPVGNAGGIALPYFAIAEQQTITSGYGAEYGRSTGGVISQVGERGGNDWHFGAYVSMQPAWAESQYSNLYYSNPNSTTTGEKYGDIYENRSNDKDWVNIYDAYISGPLIKDKLFFYLTVEGEHTQEDRTTNVTAPNYESHSFSSPKFYGKLDWNINDSNTVEFTGIQSKREDQANNYYDYDYSTNKIGAFNSVDNPLYSSKFSVGILKYTSYITDDLTLSVLYGKMWSTYYNQDENYAGYDSELAGVAGVDEQNPDVSGYGNYNNNPTTQSSPGHESRQANLRVDLDWKLGDHDIKFGIDNVRSTDVDDGTTTAGPGYYWSYGQASTLDASTPLLTNGNNYVANPVNYANGASGYYVAKVVYGATASFTVTQRAQYIEDNWQATPNLLLNIGIRNDQFTNYNAANEPYIRETKPQWQPRLGFSWDIFGDGTSKLYGNVGRYYLALPSGLGVRMAGENSYTETYYTYSSINANGIPQGLTQIYASRDPFSADGEYGTAKNASTVAAKNLKPEYQDEFVLGFQKQLGDTSLVWTNQLTYEKLRNIVDDTGDIYLPDGEEDDVLVNPGSTEDIYYVESNGSTGTLKWNPATASDGTVTGFPKPKRDYYGLEEALERPWDGKWMAKVDYVLARSWGNTEGPTNSATGQITSASGASGGGQSGSITTAWDYPTLMQYSGGELANSHRHTLKTFGTYAITPEWLISGTYIIQSGAPNVCLGYYGTAQTNPIGYGSSYHWCGGEPSRPGDSGHTPWTHQINLSLNYIPNWADKHLTFQVQVHNLLNEQNALQYYATYGSTSAPYPLYKTIEAIEQPRYMQISAKYDW